MSRAALASYLRMLIPFSLFLLVLNLLWYFLWGAALYGAIGGFTRARIVRTDGGTFDSRLCGTVQNGGSEVVDVDVDTYDFLSRLRLPDPCDGPTGCCLCASRVANVLSLNSDGACSDSAGHEGTIVALLISLYWGSKVIANTLHCTASGVVASWWFVNVDKSNERKVVVDSLFRSLTYSFGSICLGSLIVSLLKTIRVVLKSLVRQEAGFGLVSCVIHCIMAIVERLVVIFNKFALCYVAIYGYNFVRAGRSVFKLFSERGWATLAIDNDVVDSTLSWVAVLGGALTAIVTSVYLRILSVNGVNFLDDPTVTTLLVVTAFGGGATTTAATLEIVDSAVATVMVLFAENPVPLFTNHPEQANTLDSAWREFQVEAYETSGYYDRFQRRGFES